MFHFIVPINISLIFLYNNKRICIGNKLFYFKGKFDLFAFFAFYNQFPRDNENQKKNKINKKSKIKFCQKTKFKKEKRKKANCVHTKTKS